MLIANSKVKIKLCCLIFFFCFFTLSCFAEDMMKAPGRRSPPDNNERYGSGQNKFLNFYQKHISPVKGGNLCPMYPSCSQYSKICFQIFPAYKAYVMTFERILRCGQELYIYPKIKIDGVTKWYDPPSKGISVYERNIKDK